MAMNLLDMIMSAQNGAAVQQAARQTGIKPDQAQNAIAALRRLSKTQTHRKALAVFCRPYKAAITSNILIIHKA